MGKPATIRSERTISERILALSARMENLAETGEWLKVAEIMVERNAMLEDVPLVEQSSAYRAAEQSTRRLLNLARAAQSQVAEQLSAIQRGRKVADCYRKNS